MSADRQITMSVVSHRQNALVNQLLEDIGRLYSQQMVLVVTENIADPVSLVTQSVTCPVEHIVNPRPKGFGANHNAAFTRCRTPYFCVANPDIRLSADPFPALLQSLREAHAAVAGPLVRSPSGAVEDSARRFPTASILLRKLLGGRRAPDYPIDGGRVRVDWVAGMFMLFRSDAFRQINGFDERYFLYYEDVDICRRLGATGREVFYEPRAEVVHHARRASHRRIGHAWHHASGIVRFLLR
jgi:N-acetylglucosaminyl-diphospho-decaprenol L-rhamnosyltransferase